MTNDKCDWPRCKNDSELLYQQNDKDKQKSMCMEHWHVFCDMQEKGQENKARQKLGLGEIKRSNYNNIVINNKQKDPDQQNINTEININTSAAKKTEETIVADNTQNQLPKENKTADNITTPSKKTKKVKGIPRGFL